MWSPNDGCIRIECHKGEVSLYPKTNTLTFEIGMYSWVTEVFVWPKLKHTQTLDALHTPSLATPFRYAPTAKSASTRQATEDSSKRDDRLSKGSNYDITQCRHMRFSARMLVENLSFEYYY
jgi:hypothetical protein